MKFLGLSKCCFPEIFRWVVSEHSQPFFWIFGQQLDQQLRNLGPRGPFSNPSLICEITGGGETAFGRMDSAPRVHVWVKPERWMLRFRLGFLYQKRNDPGWLTWHTVGGEPKGLWWLWWLWWLCSFLFVGSEMILSFHGDIFHLKKYLFLRWLVELSRLNQEHEIGSRRPVRFLTQTCSKRQPISITKIPDINV